MIKNSSINRIYLQSNLDLTSLIGQSDVISRFLMLNSCYVWTGLDWRYIKSDAISRHVISRFDCIYWMEFVTNLVPNSLSHFLPFLLHFSVFLFAPLLLLKTGGYDLKKRLEMLKMFKNLFKTIYLLIIWFISRHFRSLRSFWVFWAAQDTLKAYNFI